MSVKTRSARGELVDFDLLKIKEQIASNPAPTDVKARQNFVDRRLRRRVKNATEREYDKALPSTEDLTKEPLLIDEVDLDDDIDMDEEDVLDAYNNDRMSTNKDKEHQSIGRRRSRKTKAPE